MRLTGREATPAALLSLLLLQTLPAAAHPHVFAEARLEIILNDDRTTVKSLRHLWRFDEIFSSTVLMEFDKNGDYKLDDAELEEVADTILTSLADFDYFQIVTVDGKDITMKPPARFITNYDNDQLIVLFESEPGKPLRLSGKLDFGVYDPTFYTAIDFVEDGYMEVANLPENCSRSVIRPDPDEALAQNQAKLTEQFFDDPAGTDMSKIFATKLELVCKG